jgi:alpha-ketoglutarate-dependent taurine dioxygenase
MSDRPVPGLRIPPLGGLQPRAQFDDVPRYCATYSNVHFNGTRGLRPLHVCLEDRSRTAGLRSGQMVDSYMTLKIEPIKPNIGAIVEVDRAALSDPAVGQRCLEALDAHDVLVFPHLGVTDSEQLAFTERLGPRVDFTRSVPGGSASEPGVYKITLDPKINTEPEYVLGTFFYHMDGMPIQNIPPPKATLLSARVVAPKGGQTEFASTRAAYEGLSAAQKAELEGLRVLHSARAGVRRVFESEAELAEIRVGSVAGARPLVWTSSSGRKSLLIGETADRIIGMPLAEGRALLARLLEWAGQPDFSYSHQWQEGDLVMWNNCGALHRVIPYDRNSGRMMHRTSLAGVEAVA